VWGLPLVAVYVPVHDKIRSEGLAVVANILRRSGGAFNLCESNVVQHQATEAGTERRIEFTGLITVDTKSERPIWAPEKVWVQ
jgi:hypothetical protein